MRTLQSRKNKIQILLVEDSNADIRLTKEVFSNLEIETLLDVVSDGESAIDFLCKRGEFTSVPTPDLILLDLNIPKIDGPSVLKMIKEDKLLRRIPVIVLTTSENDEDIVTAYDYHANAYLVKPISFHDFEILINRICNFWLKEVTFPEKVL